jgi:hypothetical protein
VIQVKKMIAIIVVAIFVLAIASVSLAEERPARPADDTSADVPRTKTQIIEKMVKPGELKEREEQEELKESTPEELKQLKGTEEQENPAK